MSKYTYFTKLKHLIFWNGGSSNLSLGQSIIRYLACPTLPSEFTPPRITSLIRWSLRPQPRCGWARHDGPFVACTRVGCAEQKARADQQRICAAPRTRHRTTPFAPSPRGANLYSTSVSTFAAQTRRFHELCSCKLSTWEPRLPGNNLRGVYDLQWWVTGTTCNFVPHMPRPLKTNIPRHFYHQKKNKYRTNF
jgi:hypothetical protein